MMRKKSVDKNLSSLGEFNMCSTSLGNHGVLYTKIKILKKTLDSFKILLGTRVDAVCGSAI